MKIVLRARCAATSCTAASARPEPTRRRSITFSPAGGTTVVLRRRRVPAAVPEPAAVAGAA